MASMITDTTSIQPSSSQPAGEEKKSEIDPTKPNDHPILKVFKDQVTSCYDVCCCSTVVIVVMAKPL